MAAFLENCQQDVFYLDMVQLDNIENEQTAFFFNFDNRGAWAVCTLQGPYAWSTNSDVNGTIALTYR